MMGVDPLSDFIWGKRDAPYISPRSMFRPAIPVMSVRSKTGLVAGKRGSFAHLDAGIAVVFEDRRARFGARFLCQGGSHNALILRDASAFGGVCEFCVDVAAGPCVYRCYDASGALVYIGCTQRFLKRKKAHEKNTPWWPEVADVQVQRYPTVFEAFAAEHLAILAENPRHNRQPRKREAA